MEQISKINMTCDSYVALEDAMVQNYIASKYRFPIVNMAILASKYDDFKRDIRAEYSDIRIDEIDVNITSKYTYIEDDGKFFLEMIYEHKNKSWTVNIYGISYEVSNSIYKLVKHYEPAGLGIYIEVDNYFFDNSGGLSIRKEFKEKEDIIDVTDKYYPYLDVELLFKRYTLSSESILMLVGQPGVGKTKLVALYEQFMFEHPEYFNLTKDTISDETMFKIAYIKNEDILARDTFWEELNKSNYNLIFLDDADNCLLPRDSESYTSEDVNRKKFISQLLSFTDGINNNDTKLIITTNRTVDNIDTAVLRRGRTFDILELQSLSQNEAKGIWDSFELSDERFDELFKDKHDIIPSELGAEIKLSLKMKDHEDAQGEYLLRDGISVLHSFRARKNKISF